MKFSKGVNISPILSPFFLFNWILLVGASTKIKIKLVQLLLIPLPHKSFEKRPDWRFLSVRYELWLICDSNSTITNHSQLGRRNFINQIVINNFE